jgi:hypothetical protein
MTRFARIARGWRGVIAVAFLGTAPLAAQVGHDPATSPYRDLRYGQFLSGTAGYMFGGGGQLGIGPHGGTVFTLRHDFLADRPLTIGLAGGSATLDRNYADLAATSDPRILGPVQDRVMFGEGVLQLNFTGGKTWNGLAGWPSEPSRASPGRTSNLPPGAGPSITVTSATGRSPRMAAARAG